MSCTSDIQTETVGNVLSVPIQSVTTREGGNMEGEQMSDEGGDGEDFQEVKEVKKEKSLKLMKLYS